MTTKNKNWKNMLVSLENKLAEFFAKKLPSLPDKLKEFIVKYGPYLAVVMLIFSIPAILGLVGVGITATPFALMGGVKGFGYILYILLGLVIFVMQIMAIPGLFKRQIKSWKLLFYISLLNAFIEIVKFDLGNLIIGTGLSWYILFQIRNYYK